MEEDPLHHQRDSSSTATYKRMYNDHVLVCPSVQSSNHQSWQPLSMTALEEYCPQITVSGKSKAEENHLWKVV